MYEITFLLSLCAPSQTLIAGQWLWLSGRAVAFDIRDPQFESRHRQTFIEHLFTVNFVEKTKMKKKRPGMAHFKKNID